MRKFITILLCFSKRLHFDLGLQSDGPEFKRIIHGESFVRIIPRRRNSRSTGDEAHIVSLKYRRLSPLNRWKIESAMPL